MKEINLAERVESIFYPVAKAPFHFLGCGVGLLGFLWRLTN
jgi:hypothetical protein